MKNAGKSLLGSAIAALGLWVASPASAFDWPIRLRARSCDHCGQPLSGVRYFTAPDHVCQPYVAAPAGSFPPGMVAPPGMAAPPGAAPVPGMAPPPGAPGPGTPPSTPGATPPAGGENPPGQPPAAPDANAPPTPDATPPANTPDATPPAQSAGLGGVPSAPQGAMNMFGDVSPQPLLAAFQSARALRPPPPPEPPPVRGHGESTRSAAFVPSVRSFKIADNQTPMPVDRITYSFNFFDYLNQSVNRRNDVPLNRIEAYRHIFGFEKTLFNQNASFGMRLPLLTVTADSTLANFGQTKTSLGDLTAYFKYALWIDRAQGRVVSTGMSVTMPTGPTPFAGAPYLRGLHYTTLQPYLGFQWTQGDWYFINFNSIDVPTNSRDVTIIYNDFSVGYFMYRNGDPNGLIQSVSPTFEVHVNSPLNHNHPFNFGDIASTGEVVNLTEGLNIFLKNKSVLSLGIVDPVTGPRPFSLEAMVLFNKFF